MRGEFNTLRFGNFWFGPPQILSDILDTVYLDYVREFCVSYEPLQTKGHTMKSLVDDWNASLEETTAMVENHNKKIDDAYRAGMLLPETVLNAIEPIPSKVSCPSDSWLRWWKGAWGWTLLTRSPDEAGWLPYGHCDMEAARSATKNLITQEGVHPFLVLNYDQCWRNAFSLNKAPLMFKDRSGTGRRVGKTKMNPRGDKKIHAVRGARRSITVPKLEVLAYVMSSFSCMLRETLMLTYLKRVECRLKEFQKFFIYQERHVSFQFHFALGWKEKLRCSQVRGRMDEQVRYAFAYQKGS